MWEFDREKKVFSQKSPRGSGWQSHYYRYKGKDGKYHTNIEDFFKIIESKTKPIVDKINNKTLINEDEKIILATFISFQYTRVPDFQKKMDESSEKMIKKISQMRFSSIEATKKIIEEMEKKNIDTANKVTPKEIFEFVQRGSYSVKIPRERSIKDMLILGESMFKYFVQMDWLFLYTPKESSFILSDNPFFIIPPDNRDLNNFWDRGVGIITPGARKVMPLSSKVCLIMLDYGNKIISKNIDGKRVRSINQWTATSSDRFVYAKDKPLLERIIKDTKIDQWMKKERIIMS